MSIRIPSATARQRGAAKKSKLKDLAPQAGSAQRVKGGPIVWPGAVTKRRKS